LSFFALIVMFPGNYHWPIGCEIVDTDVFGTLRTE